VDKKKSVEYVSLNTRLENRHTTFFHQFSISIIVGIHGRALKTEMMRLIGFIYICAGLYHVIFQMRRKRTNRENEDEITTIITLFYLHYVR
jgi:protein-S-isoprenylcysteine O-methyltransferase Ste14